MSRFKLLFDGEYEDEVFDTEEEPTTASPNSVEDQ